MSLASPRWAGSLVLFVLLLGSAAHAQGGGRFALVVGANRGLLDEEELHYAEDDAVRMRWALVDVGGFTDDNVAQLLSPNAESLRTALERLKSRMGPGPHERLFVYVSSHAADGSLHLGGTELFLRELVDFVKAAPVQVGLLVIDACQSGRVTRLKGLRRSDIPATRIEATGLEGRVLISSAGVDEYAQESDALQGSYFTHYFVAGLRGAADSSRDGQVTLDEAYAWAWARTIEATFASRGGVQRPAFSVDLRGAGQLVMAEPSKSASRLELAVQSPGRWLVVSEATGRLFADVEKGASPLSLAVPPGEYRLQLRTARGVLERRVSVPANGGVAVSGDEFERVALVEVARKGGAETKLGLSVSGSVASGLVGDLKVQPGAELRLRREGYLVGPLNQLEITLGWRDGRSQTETFMQTELELRAGTGHRFSWERLSLAVGVEAGPLLVLQALVNGSRRASLSIDFCLVLEGRLKLWGPFELSLLGTSGAAVVKRYGGALVAPRLSAALGLVVFF